MNGQFGLTATQQQLLISIIKNKLEHHKIRISVFGSRARGDYKAASDIDILIEAKPAIDSKLKRQISAELGESRFPFKVDLVLPQEIYSHYLETIEAEKKILYSDG